MDAKREAYEDVKSLITKEIATAHLDSLKCEHCGKTLGTRTSRLTSLYMAVSKL